jgi:hypothetical protein
MLTLYCRKRPHGEDGDRWNIRPYFDVAFVGAFFARCVKVRIKAAKKFSLGDGLLQIIATRKPDASQPIPQAHKQPEPHGSPYCSDPNAKAAEMIKIRVMGNALEFEKIAHNSS